jgi:protein phosphatase 2C family protein 2/3
VARFAGQNVHKRLVTEESYKKQDWKMALKRAFLGTDEDLLASRSFLESVIFEKFIPWKDPAHTRDPSGCTAVAALVTNDNKLYVVSPWNDPIFFPYTS